MRRLLKLRKDNRGDTLVIVLVGIFLLGLLGSAILASAAINIQMKSIDRGNKKNFYTVEQALDEVYAGIGEDVMNSMEYAYSYVLNNMLVIDDETGKYITSDNTELNKMFRNIFFYSLTKREPVDKVANWNEIRFAIESEILDPNNTPYAIYQNDTGMRGSLTEHLNGFIDSLDTGSYEPAVSIPDTEAIAVEYDAKDAVNTAGDIVSIDTFTLKNVTVTYTSGDEITNRVSADIVVEVPIVDINFSEVTTIDYGELLKYSLVVEGDDVSTDPVVSVNSNMLVNGNIYAGEIASENKEGIRINDSQVDVGGSNVVTSGDLVLRNGKFNLYKSNVESSLRFWAKNIITLGDQDQITMTDVDCILKDDLQVDGTNSQITITGGYYGIGYRDVESGTGEADSEENDWMYFSADGSQAYDANGNTVANPTSYEHESSSAIIINGRDAAVNLSGLKNMLIAGRAYVDLLDPDNLSGGVSTYMTGESISVRGSQNAYLAELNTDYFNEKDGKTVVLTNPVSSSFFDANILNKGVLTDSTIAKKVGDSIYFYRKSTNPVDQTNIFEQYFNSTTNKKELREKINELGVKELLIGNDTNIMSVGAMLKVDHSLTESQSVLVKEHNVEGGVLTSTGMTDKFYNKSLYNYVTDCNVRFKAMLTELKDYGDIVDFSVPSAYITAINNSTKTPISTYINSDNFNKIFDLTLQDLDVTKVSGGEHYQNEIDTVSSGIFDVEGGSYNDYNIRNTKANIIITKKAVYELPSTIDCGVIIAQNDVIVRGNFTGIIICEGDIIIEGADTVELNAHPDLVRWLADNDKTFSQCLKGYLAVSQTGEGDASGHVTINNIEYKDLVSYKNWKKLSPNAS